VSLEVFFEPKHFAETSLILRALRLNAPKASASIKMYTFVKRAALANCLQILVVSQGDFIALMRFYLEQAILK
jgi:hypothetical protein